MERYCDGMIAPRTRRQLTQLGASLRRARNEAGLTQDQLGDLAGVSRQLVSRVESGSPRGEIGRVVQIAAALGLRLVVAPTAHVSPDHEAINNVITRIRHGAVAAPPQVPDADE